jgi:hypothetical protein
MVETTMTHDDPAGEWSLMRAITPRAYVCHRAKNAIAVDGKLNDEAWADASWTDEFEDIEGARKPVPRFGTRAKLLWDDTFLYIAAEMVEPHVCATLTQKNSVMFQDNDFEIFIDPDGDNHNYYEFEINALGTIWELTLPKPYKDGGKPKNPSNLAGLRSTVSVRGTINDPRDEDRGWTVEIAIPWSELAAYNAGRATPPREGDFWRINFSRVQWRYDVVAGKYVKRDPKTNPEDNWVWSPQGIVDMHRPERWGFVMFTSQPAGSVKAVVDPTLTARDSLMEVYHRQRVFHTKNGKWAHTLAELAMDVTCIELRATGEGFTATTVAKIPGVRDCKLEVRQDSKLTILDQ